MHRARFGSKTFDPNLKKYLTNNHPCAIIKVQSKEVITMVTDAELVFWCVMGVMCVLFVCALPFINNYIEYKETERMFNR